MPKTKLTFREFTWTPELAYIVGLLVTDGNLSRDGRHINMRSSDWDLLEIFRNCLKLKNKIAQSHNDGYAKKPSYRVQFGSVQLYNWLVSIGVTPAKTHTIGKIKIPDEYFQDFLRGHLDGDGTIFTYQDTYNTYKGKQYVNTRLYTKFISASAKHIRWLHSMIKKNSPVCGVLLHRKGDAKRTDMWEIKFSKYESLKLFEWLYYDKNLPALERKRKLADYFLGKINQGKLIRL